MTCLIKVSEFIKRVYGEDGTPPARQTITRWCIDGQLPAHKRGKLWFIDWNVYQKQTGDNLVDKVLRG